MADKPSAPSRVWNRIGKDIQDQIVEMALEATDLSPRELAVRFTDEKHYFVSEATAYRLLKAHDLVTSPAYAMIKGEALSAIGPRTMVERTVPYQDHAAERDVADRIRCYARTFGSPPSRSSGGAGCICRRCLTTSRATSSPGSCAPACGPRT
ncbi:helix-turn-helix domain-containing protein [Paracoccus aminophilus]|uniref:helix-turn-helix domain-containing protein n=1 Tax=Paracoccus aminophilus TaxID=34003 RepID=UPI002E1EF284